MTWSRRKWLQAGTAFASAAVLPGWAKARPTPRVVVIGGGFAGATCASELKRWAPDVKVTLVEPKTTYTACPLSNMVLAGERRLSAQQFGYQNLADRGIEIIHVAAQEIDPHTHTIMLTNGRKLSYDRAVAAVGIDMQWGAIEGYNKAAAEVMPHAWQAGPQTELLQKQLQNMRPGGTVVISAPEAPYRCPPGPYERASLIAHYLQKTNPSAKLLVLDAKDQFSKQTLFQQGWQALYGNLIEWQGLSDGARVIAVDVANKQVITEFDTVQADVVNLIPPQQAARLAHRGDLVDVSGWCPIEPSSSESKRLNDIHVIGDAAIANAMPKSAFAANAQARLCAQQVIARLRGQPLVSATLINTCYSLVAPDYAISVAGVYKANAESWASVPGAGGVSDLDANDETRKLEAIYANAWFDTLTAQVFG